jgi:hypothetical protein
MTAFLIVANARISCHNQLFLIHSRVNLIIATSTCSGNRMKMTHTNRGGWENGDVCRIKLLDGRGHLQGQGKCESKVNATLRSSGVDIRSYLSSTQQMNARKLELETASSLHIFM